MGLLGKKSDEEYLKEFHDEGFKCKAIIGAGGTRIIHWGFGIASAKQSKKKADGRFYKKEKGLRFIPEKEHYIEIRIPWENIIHVGREKYGDRGLYIYTDDGGCIVISDIELDRREFAANVVAEECNLLNDDLEGWE